MKYRPRAYHWLGLLLLMFLSGCSTGYQRKAGSFIYVTWDEGRGRLEHPIEGVDPQSFEILDKHGYAKDKVQAYYHDRSVDGSDPATFVAIAENYAKDAARVYYQGEVIPNADPATFSPIDVQWAKDKNDIYLQNFPLDACDPASFEFLKDDWQRDRQCVYRGSAKLVGADPSSFVVINYFYAKDKNNVYSSAFPNPIEGADAATFKLRAGVCDVCAEDKNRCYRFEEVVACESLP